jgi:hypothetical protein
VRSEGIRERGKIKGIRGTKFKIQNWDKGDKEDKKE